MILQQPSDQQYENNQTRQQSSADQQLVGEESNQQRTLQQQASEQQAIQQAYLGQTNLENAVFNAFEKGSYFNWTPGTLSEQWSYFNRNDVYGTIDHRDGKPDFSFFISDDPRDISFKGEFQIRVIEFLGDIFQKIHGLIPDGNMKDFLSGAAKMGENYASLIAWNHKEQNWDKFFHCMANCEASEFGTYGMIAALIISDLRDSPNQNQSTSDQRNDAQSDHRANALGRESTFRCYSSCSEAYLPDAYRTSTRPY